MHSKYSVRALSLLIFLPLLFRPVALNGQSVQENLVSLKNWAAPLYWQPNQMERAERESAVGIAPKLEFSASQVSPSALTFVAVTPCRLVDTRGVPAGFNGLSPFSGPSFAPSSTVTFPVQSAAEAMADTTPTPCGTIPSIAQAYSFNITVIPKTSGGVAFLSIWPAGSPQPAVSTINDGQGEIIANAAIVPAGTPSGGITVFNSGPAATDLIIDMNGFYAAPTDLTFNTAVGAGALVDNTTGGSNTAIGSAALQKNTNGSNNTAAGFDALTSNISGFGNTASGAFALAQNTSGGNNTASGFQALQNNTAGIGNTATGANALTLNIAGGGNTATGFNALANNSTGNNNTASGEGALIGNTSGVANTATGGATLASNNSGGSNTADGYFALMNNTTGNNNTASGLGALSSNTNGSNNIAVGYQAAIAASPSGSNNIHIGSVGSSGDSGVIRIGTQGNQTSFFVAGVNGATATNSTAAVLIDTTNGQLVAASSSRRYKEDIEDMGEASRDLMRLRPVTFRYKKPFADGTKPIQYGLIAEEVDEVYPDLVAHSADGQIETVKYQLLPAMLLNEAQKQHQHAQQQDETIQQQHDEILKLEARLAALEALLSGKVPTAAAAGR
jgi:hypothetical protein